MLLVFVLMLIDLPLIAGFDVDHGAVCGFDLVVGSAAKLAVLRMGPDARGRLNLLCTPCLAC
jgi:hypothetical protein